MIAQSYYNAFSGKNNIKIDSIHISGNKTTKDFIILRELSFSAGDTVSKSALAYNRERVYSLGIFNKVNFNIDNKTKLNILNIQVEESWYIYPVPFLNWRENTIAKSSYGVFLLYKNFRGRNETLQALASFGYDPSYFLFYTNPLLIPNEDINLKLGLFYRTISNKSLLANQIFGKNFNYKTSGGFLTIGKRLNLYNDVSLSSGFNYIEAPQNISGFTASNERIDRFAWVGIEYKFDSRNLKQFSENGIFTSINFVHNGLINDKVNYNSVSIDFREYRPVFFNITARWRIAYRATLGHRIPLYDFSFFGSGTYIRGHITEDREGNNLLLGSLELSYPLIKEWHVSLNLPLLPKSLTTARIGLRFNVFGDTGLTYNNGQSIILKNFDSGWGVGLAILFLPYNAVRFEYSFNENLRGEFTVGTGFAF